MQDFSTPAFNGIRITLDQAVLGEMPNAPALLAFNLAITEQHCSS
jgi:hypothetical protein